MKPWSIASLALALLLAGCTSTAPAPTPIQSVGLTPYAIAFWDEQNGLLTGQSGCPVQCGDYIIALTDDGGNHWKEVYRGADRVGELATVPGGAWASTDKGLLKSTDGGETWQATATGYEEPTFAGASIGWTLAATEGNRWNVESPIFTTRDAGATWKALNSPCTGRLGGTRAINLVSETEGWVGCVSEPGAGQQLKALYKTTDSGTTWKEAAGMGGGGYLSGLFFRPGGKGWVWRSRGGLSVTEDGGQTWQWPGTVQPETLEARDLWMVSDQAGYLLLQDNEDRQFKLVKTVDGGTSVSLVRQWPIDPPRSQITKEEAIEAARKILEPKEGHIVDAKLDPARVFDGKSGREVVATWLVTYQMQGGPKTIVFIDATTGASRGVMQVN